MHNYHNDSNDHPNSWYAATAELDGLRAPVLSDRKCDVCIVGAGYTGLSAAIDLATKGYDVLVLDAHRVGWGASGRNGGQVVRAYTKGQDQIAGWVGREDANRLWDLSEDAMDLLRDRVATHTIDCDLTWGYIHAAEKDSQVTECRHTYEEWSAHGAEGLYVMRPDQINERVASPRYIGGLYDPGSGHLHPLKYALGLGRAAEAAGATIAENSRVETLEGYDQPGPVRLKLATGATVTANHVLLAGNAYLKGVAQEIEGYVMPVGTHVVATEVLGENKARSLIPENEAVCDLYFVLNYYRRSPDHRLLFGGRVSYSGLDLPDVTKHTGAKMAKIFPQLKDTRIEYSWGGFVGITMKRMPHLGKVGPNTFFAHGFSGHGVVLTGMAGRVMAEAIAGTAERFDLMARVPHAKFPGGRLLRTPALVLAMAWYRMRDLL
jgi:gamma-glutamylputrescine oxidase